MASKMVDPIDWPSPRTFTLQYPWTIIAQDKSVQSPQGIDTVTFGIRGNNLAFAATQGIKI